jgi:hypothetical protein
MIVIGNLALKLTTVVISIALLLSLSTSLYLFYRGDNVNSMLLIYPTIVSLIILAFLCSTKPHRVIETEEVEQIES